MSPGGRNVEFADTSRTEAGTRRNGGDVGDGIDHVGRGDTVEDGMHDGAKFKQDTEFNREPVKRSKRRCDVVTRAETKNETCCGIHDTLQLGYCSGR